MSIISNFEPVKINSNIVNFNTDPFKELDVFPAPPFDDVETIRKRNKSLLDKFLELATDTPSDDKKEDNLEFKIPGKKESSKRSTNHQTSNRSYDNDISFKELIEQENLPIKITSGYRNTLTAQGKPSNHSKRDSKGNPMAYDIIPKSGYTFEDLRKILYNNPRVVAWFKNKGWGVLEEMQDGKSRGFYDVRGKFHYTKATGPHFHIGPDHYGVEWYGSKVNKNLYYAQEGIKLPQINFISKFEVPEFKKPEIRYFNPEDINPFTHNNSSYNKELIEGLYNLAKEKKKKEDSNNPLLNSPFYAGNSIPKRKDSNDELSSEENYTRLSGTESSSEGNYTKLSETEASKKITKFLLDKGLSKYAVAGIVGNLYAESRFNTSVLGDEKTSGGIAQWHANRFTNLKQFASKNGKDWKDLDLQLNFLWHELTTKYSSVLNKIQKTNSAEEAAEIWGHDYEVFSGYDNFNHKRYKLRRNYAKQFYKLLS